MPFAVEFQDPWASFYVPRVRPYAYRALRSVLEGASFTLNVCEAWCAADARDFGLRSVCIPTGFWERPAPPRVEDPARPLRLAYAGSLWYFDLRPLVEGLRLARDRGVPWRFEYYGNDGPLVARVFGAAGVADLLDLRGYVVPEEALDTLSLADLLLLFTMPSKASTFGFKFAEVISRGLPVLLVGPDDPAIRGVAGKLVELHPCPDAASVAAAVALVARARPIRPKPNPEVGAWTWPSLARRLVEVMREAADRRGKT
jgi:glycosyltransferase involved in cell wall biosynthesis